MTDKHAEAFLYPFLSESKTMEHPAKELLQIAAQIRQLSQNGLVYAADEYNRERYEELLSLSHRMASLLSADGVGEEQIAACFHAETDYVTPKVDIRAVVFNDREEILLVRERADGRWSLPGGWADVGYSPTEVAVKEVHEETGYEVRPLRLLAVHDKKCHAHPPALHYAYKIFIQCECIGGTPAEAFDTLGCGFFAQNALPPLSEERVLPEQIDRMFAYFRDSTLAPEID